MTLIPMLLGAAELTIDHVTVAGKDLKAMRASLAAAGIQSEYGGPHSNHATEMALTSFPDGSYLELIAIQPNADPRLSRPIIGRNKCKAMPARRRGRSVRKTSRRRPRGSRPLEWSCTPPRATGGNGPME